MRTKDLTGPDALPPRHLPQIVQFGEDKRYLYPHLATQPLAAGELGITEFTQTGTRTVTGNVERDPQATGEKAELAVEIDLANPDVKQLAVLISDVPNALLEGVATLQAFLQAEAQVQLNLALDDHVLAAIAASSPPAGADGADLIAQIRNAVATMRGTGANPSLLALSPEDAAGLDLDTRGSDDAYTFATRDAGSSSPLWGLQIVEVAGADAPVLIDPQTLGVLFTGPASLTTDPYSGFKVNTTDLRLEGNVLFHVRAATGAYEVTSS